MDIESAIRERFQNLEWALDERLRRLFAASEAKVLGHGGITLVQKATGVARNSIKLGLKELLNSQNEGVIEDDASRRLRRKGGGRKASVKDDKKLIAALDMMVSKLAKIDLPSLLTWVKLKRQIQQSTQSQNQGGRSCRKQ